MAAAVPVPVPAPAAEVDALAPALTRCCKTEEASRRHPGGTAANENAAEDDENSPLTKGAESVPAARAASLNPRESMVVETESTTRVCVECGQSACGEEGGRGGGGGGRGRTSIMCHIMLLKRVWEWDFQNGKSADRPKSPPFFE